VDEDMEDYDDEEDDEDFNENEGSGSGSGSGSSDGEEEGEDEKDEDSAMIDDEIDNEELKHLGKVDVNAARPKRKRN
jgi:hypothetical protein